MSDRKRRTSYLNHLVKMVQGEEPNVFAMAPLYLAIIYAGMPVTMTYNLTAGVLRSLGNSRAPLIAMVCASAANIALDLLFVAWLQWGVAGAAAATVLAQGLAAGVCLLALRRIPEIRLRRQERSFRILTESIARPAAIASRVNSFCAAFEENFRAPAFVLTANS